MSLEINSCPRCGSDNTHLVSETDVFDMNVDDFAGEEIYEGIRCGDCGLLSKLSTDIYYIVDQWNNPVDTPEFKEVKRSGKITTLTRRGI